eukprot:4872872-Amphidinium_carterae.1
MLYSISNCPRMGRVMLVNAGSLPSSLRFTGSAVPPVKEMCSNGARNAGTVVKSLLVPSAGRQVEVHKYVADMVMVAAGPYFAHSLSQPLQDCGSVQRGTRAKQNLWQVWRAGRLPPVKLTTHDLGVDSQWAFWRSPVQKKRISTFHQLMNRVLALGLPAHVKGRSAKSLHNVGLYGAKVGSITTHGMSDLRISARRALGKGASLRNPRPLSSSHMGAHWSSASLCRPKHLGLCPVPLRQSSLHSS